MPHPRTAHSPQRRPAAPGMARSTFSRALTLAGAAARGALGGGPCPHPAPRLLAAAGSIAHAAPPGPGLILPGRACSSAPARRPTASPHTNTLHMCRLPCATAAPPRAHPAAAGRSLPLRCSRCAAVVSAARAAGRGEARLPLRRPNRRTHTPDLPPLLTTRSLTLAPPRRPFQACCDGWDAAAAADDDAGAADAALGEGAAGERWVGSAPAPPAFPSARRLPHWRLTSPLSPSLTLPNVQPASGSACRASAMRRSASLVCPRPWACPLRHPPAISSVRTASPHPVLSLSRPPALTAHYHQALWTPRRKTCRRSTSARLCRTTAT